MIDGLIRWCLKNAFLVVLFMLALVGGGYYAVQNMPVDAIPDIGEKQVIVFADWPGRSPQDGPPDRIEYDTHWFEADGTGITDKARIAELESQESHHGRSPHQ